MHRFGLPGVAGLVQELRELGGLSTPRFTTQHCARVLPHSLHDHLLFRQHWQLQTGFLEHTAPVSDSRVLNPIMGLHPKVDAFHPSLESY